MGDCNAAQRGHFLAETDAEKTPTKHSEAGSEEPETTDCEECRKLDLVLNHPGDESYFPDCELELSSDAAESECQYHGPLYQYLRLNQKDPFLCEIAKMHGASSLWVEGHNFQLIHNKLKPALQGPALLLDPDWVDTKLLHKWKEHCLCHHQRCSQKNSSDNHLTERPVLLIDTRSMCLVDAPLDASYVALSYVWGSVSTFRTEKQNLAQLKKDQSLQRRIDGLQIPKTIIHAIRLVEILRERYLWVDTLCIVQDDEVFRHSQIRSMASIYSNSLVTIVAAEGNDVQHGISGLRGISDPRSCSQKILDIGKHSRFLDTPNPNMAQRVWYNRGWTFQEQVFSRRRLIFGDDRVRWECVEQAFQEDIDYQINPEGAANNLSEETVSGSNMLKWPDPDCYTELVHSYSHRKFTYAKDAYFACAGFLSHISDAYDGGFLYGFPKIFFDHALLWQPRITIERRLAGPVSDFSMPSWSWMGWQGAINVWGIRSAREFIKVREGREIGQPYFKTTSTVQWYYKPTQSGHNRRPIQVTCNKYVQEFSVQSLELPVGWTKHDFDWNDLDSEMQDAWPDKRTARSTYRYEHAPDCEFWYPIPVLQNKPREVIEPSVESYLYGKTTRASFSATRYNFDFINDYNVDDDPSGACLRDGEGNWAGFLTFHDREEQKRLLASEEKAAQPVVFDLVEISAGSYGNDSDHHILEEFFLDERPKNGPFYEYYNVLWVSWDRGIAYRKGLGRVMKSAWEAADREVIDLVLG